MGATKMGGVIGVGGVVWPVQGGLGVLGCAGSGIWVGWCGAGLSSGFSDRFSSRWGSVVVALHAVGWLLLPRPDIVRAVAERERPLGRRRLFRERIESLLDVFDEFASAPVRSVGTT